MSAIVIFINENNNRWEFRVDGNTAFVYAECFESALKKLKDIFGPIELEK